jgi:hypothetical protein
MLDSVAQLVERPDFHREGPRFEFTYEAKSSFN